MTLPFGFPLFLAGFCLTGGMVALTEAMTLTMVNEKGEPIVKARLHDAIWIPALLGAFYFFISADSLRLLFTSILLDLAITGLASLVLYLWSRKVGDADLIAMLVFGLWPILLVDSLVYASLALFAINVLKGRRYVPSLKLAGWLGLMVIPVGLSFLLPSL